MAEEEKKVEDTGKMPDSQSEDVSSAEAMGMGMFGKIEEDEEKKSEEDLKSDISEEDKEEKPEEEKKSEEDLKSNISEEEKEEKQAEKEKPEKIQAGSPPHKEPEKKEVQAGSPIHEEEPEKVQAGSPSHEEEEKIIDPVEAFWKEHDYLEPTDYLTVEQQRKLDEAKENKRKLELQSQMARKAKRGVAAVEEELADKKDAGLDFRTVAAMGGQLLKPEDWNEYGEELKENPDAKAVAKLFYNKCMMRAKEMREWLDRTEGKKSEVRKEKDLNTKTLREDTKSTKEEKAEEKVEVNMKSILGGSADMARAMYGSK